MQSLVGLEPPFTHRPESSQGEGEGPGVPEDSFYMESASQGGSSA